MKKILPVIMLIILVWGCAKKITPATSETSSSNTQSIKVDTSLSKTAGTITETTAEATAVITGQATYNAKCGRCHGLKVTTNYTAERWIGILAVMTLKANLTETEKANVYAYVKENAKK